ncbi:RluA family pseudouridine synthase [Limnoglobus roseus]|uniref:Pseudouridine synthase n=1 Tax=Limnoglobus roseus TaxID=2598579 RepID=A0A5C1A9F1_9BACT|nr:RluA family pseudouridine synthase [Limnoglobus roseus]QEL14676.1 RluA family pseudouridine synthase [Limnoglobus roseus]
MNLPPFTVLPAEAEHTLAKVLRSRLHASQPSWNDVRAMIENRRVKVGDSVCTDPARRVHEGEVVELLAKPTAKPRNSTAETLVIRHLDDHVVVVEKPSGVSSVRHPAELEWTEKRKQLDPTLQDVTQWAIAGKLNRSARSLPPLRIVHRLDKETSGLLMFARSVLAERELGQQFRKHTVVRRYLAVVPGIVSPRTIRSTLIRDRGDGRRGSTKQPDVTGKDAITHIAIEERLPKHMVLSCRLETGRTHQIRIHLSEAGHPVCGEKVYNRTQSGDPLPETPAPRLALHATELGFEHPVTGEHLHWAMPLPPDLQKFVDGLRK